MGPLEKLDDINRFFFWPYCDKDKILTSMTTFLYYNASYVKWIKLEGCRRRVIIFQT